MQVTDDDRFVLTALASAMEAEVGKDTHVADNLFRQASLWGAHPTGDVVLKPITGDAEATAAASSAPPATTSASRRTAAADHSCASLPTASLPCASLPSAASALPPCSPLPALM